MEQNCKPFANDPIPPHIHTAIQTAERLGEEHLWRRARDLLLQVEDELRELHVSSAHLFWLLAVACDSIGQLEDAIAYIARARAADLVSSRAISSERVIVGRVVSLIEIGGPQDPEALALVSALHRNFPSNHPALPFVAARLAESASEPGPRAERAVA